VQNNESGFVDLWGSQDQKKADLDFFGSVEPPKPANNSQPDPFGFNQPGNFGSQTNLNTGTDFFQMQNSNSKNFDSLVFDNNPGQKNLVPRHVQNNPGAQLAQIARNAPQIDAFANLAGHQQPPPQQQQQQNPFSGMPMKMNSNPQFNNITSFPNFPQNNQFSLVSHGPPQPAAQFSASNQFNPQFQNSSMFPASNPNPPYSGVSQLVPTSIFANSSTANQQMVVKPADPFASIGPIPAKNNAAPKSVPLVNNNNNNNNNSFQAFTQPHGMSNIGFPSNQNQSSGFGMGQGNNMNGGFPGNNFGNQMMMPQGGFNQNQRPPNNNPFGSQRPNEQNSFF